MVIDEASEHYLVANNRTTYGCLIVSYIWYLRAAALLPCLLLCEYLISKGPGAIASFGVTWRQERQAAAPKLLQEFAFFNCHSHSCCLFLFLERLNTRNEKFMIAIQGLFLWKNHIREVLWEQIERTREHQTIILKFENQNSQIQASNIKRTKTIASLKRAQS